MEVDLYEGKYVVAVSGGVDSVVLLDLLVRLKAAGKDLELIIAHFDHGIRPDSEQDRLFVESLAKEHNLEFIYDTASLGPDTSEERARNARYSFLNKAAKDNQATGLVLAHHQDDLIETAILNIIRGTGRRGLSSLKSTDKLLRPLLKYPKKKIVNYAKTNQLKWREDSTNQDPKYLRNYIRSKVVPGLGSEGRSQLLETIEKQADLNDQVDLIIDQLLEEHLVDNRLPRLWLASLDSTLSKEIIATWLRLNGLMSYDRRLLERLDISLKVSKTNDQTSLMSGYLIRTDKDCLALDTIER